MFGLLIATALIGSPFHFKVPEPYVGLGIAFSPRKTEIPNPDFDSADATSAKTIKISQRRKFLLLGAPFQMAETGPISWQILPEVIYNPMFLAGDLGVGPDYALEFGYRQIPSAMIFAFHFGAHYGAILDKKNYTNDKGLPLGKDEEEAWALYFNMAFGPRFDFGEKISGRLVLNPKFFLGKVHSQTFRTEFSDNVGLIIGLNAQADF